MDPIAMGGIRVKNFANLSEMEQDKSADEIRSLSSDDDDFVVRRRLRSTKRNTTEKTAITTVAAATTTTEPKISAIKTVKRRRSTVKLEDNRPAVVTSESVEAQKTPKTASKTPRRRRSKIKSEDSSCKKISDFFQPTLKLETPSTSTMGRSTSPKSMESKENGRKRKAPEPKVERARRRLCPGTDLRMVSNRYMDDNQSRVSNFYEKTKGSEFDYFTVMKASKLPATIDGDMNVEDFLDIRVTEESKIVELPAVELYPEITLERLQNPVLDDDEIERQAWNMEERTVAVQNLTTIEEEPPEKPVNVAQKSKKAPKAPRKKIVCPKYKIISGTTFSVDAFRFGKIDGITHYFLTHFHSDHHIGLNKTFDMPLICSSITARLVRAMIKVDAKYIQSLDVHETITIAGVEITAIDANHCPGALMFVFKLPNGCIALHTGDFRATPEMESLPIFWNNDITEIYLDTTYLMTKYDLMPQCDCIARCLEATKSYYEKHCGDKVLIVCGAYVIGKEKVWTAIAQQFNLKVWAESKRRKALQEIGDPQMLQYLVDDPKDAQLHVVNMNVVNYDDLKSYLGNFPDHFTHVIGFKPSGWQKTSRPRHQGNVSVIGVEYSEHSSYNEMRRFVSFLRPKTIISTVPISSDPNETPKIPLEWYTGEIKPKRDIIQIKINEQLPVLANNIKGESSRPLNPSVKRRRMEMNESVNHLQILETIELESSEFDSQETDTEFPKL